MDGTSSITAIDQKMAEMRIKNLELLKRHQEIEEDRQRAQRSGTTTTTTAVEVTEDTPTTTMRGTTKNRARNTATQQYSQENLHEQTHRPPARRKFENDRTDIPSQRAQRVDYNRLKHERAQEVGNQHYNNSISSELLEYAYPFHYQSENNYDAGESAHAKKLVIVNNQATRIGSGRFNQQQQQRTQEQGPRRREERMRRSGVHNNGHPGGPSEFHLDVSQIPMWQNGSIPPPPPIHVQLLPTNMNGHHTGIDHLMNNGGDQLDQSAYLHNFVYSPSAQSSPFNGNGTVYFTHQPPPPPPMPTGPPSSQSSQPHFQQYHPTRTFENSNRHQFQHPSHFQSSPVFPPPPLPQLLTPSTSTSHTHQSQENPPADLPPRFRRLKKPDQENKYPQQRPMSGDFGRLRNSFSHFNNDNRFQTRPQSFYDFSSQQQSNNHFIRSSSNNNNNRYQRNNNNNNSLPLSAYMNTDDSSYENENANNNNYWGSSSYQRRRSTQQRTNHQDKHQFPLSSYDPRQYGFNNNYQRRTDFNNRSHSNRRNINNNRINTSNDIDLIEEWWEDDNSELIGTNQPTANIDSQPTTATTIDDSGNSSLSTSIHLKESALDDEESNISIKDFISPTSDASTTDSNIIESLDQLQQQLKLEEAVEQQLALENDNEFLSLNKEPTTYDTAHFMQWAKEKFRKELAGRLTAKEIEQHDAITTDDDDDDDDIVVTAHFKIEKFHSDQTTDEDNDNHVDELEDDLNEKLTIKENPNKSIIVE